MIRMWHEYSISFAILITMEKLYDTLKIGARIARGGDRTVYWYGENHVIKFSSIPYVVGSRMSEKMSRDYALCKKYFGDYIVETVLIDQDGGRRHIEIQPYIHGENLHRAHLKIKGVRMQLETIATAMQIMEKDGYAPIDLIGISGLFHMRFCNIFVDEHNNLRIFDTTLLEGSSVGFLGVLVTPLFWLATMRQRYVMKNFLK